MCYANTGPDDIICFAAMCLSSLPLLLKPVMIKIKIRFIVMHTSAFNPSRLAPVDSHMHRVTHSETDAIHWSGGQPFTAAREHGGTVPCFKGTSAVTRRLTDTPPAVSFTNLCGESGNRTANLPDIGQTTLTTECVKN